MNDQSPLEVNDNEVQRWANSHMILWEAESNSHCKKVRKWMESNCPLQDNADFEMVKEYQTSDKSGMVIVEFDDNEMTEEDALHLEKWLQDFPANQVIYQPMMGLGGIVRFREDEPEVELGSGRASKTLH